MPPLRERREDIIELARYFLERHRALRPLRCRRPPPTRWSPMTGPATSASCSESSSARSRSPSGSARARRSPAGVLGGYAEVLRAVASRRRDTMRAWGSRYARLVLERCANNKRRACRELGISLSHAAGLHPLPAVRSAGRAAAAADES